MKMETRTLGSRIAGEQETQLSIWQVNFASETQHGLAARERQDRTSSPIRCCTDLTLKATGQSDNFQPRPPERAEHNRSGRERNYADALRARRVERKGQRPCGGYRTCSDIRSRDSKGKGRRPPSEPCDPSDEHVCQSTKYRSRTRADFLTWNVGVLATERTHEILTIMPVVGLEHTQVVAFQGSNCKPGVCRLDAGKGDDGLQIVIAKKPAERRGRAVAIGKNFGSVEDEQVANHALGVIIRRARGKIGVLDVHLPPRTAIPEA